MSISFANRSFTTSKIILSASERSTQKRQIAIYNELRKNVMTLNTDNPVKTDGYTYNKNSIKCDISNGNVNVGGSYEIIADIKQGASLLYPVTVSTPKYENWCGNTYSVDYFNHGVIQVVQLIDVSLNNIIVDPSHVLFYDDCAFGYGNINRPEPWTSVVDLM